MLKGGKAHIPPKISEVLGRVLSERALAASERRPYRPKASREGQVPPCPCLFFPILKWDEVELVPPAKARWDSAPYL